MKWGPGKLLFIHIADSASQDMKELTQAELVAGKGIKGIAITMARAIILISLISEKSRSLKKKCWMHWNKTSRLCRIKASS